MTNDPQAFDGCNSECRKAGAHTLRWGGCEHAPKPEPTVSMSAVYTDADGYPSLGFDSYTVDQLAELLDPVLGFEAVRARRGSVDLAHLAAHAIVHRNDDTAAEPDDTDLTESDIDRMMAAGVPVQIVTAPPGTFAVDPNAPSLEFHAYGDAPASVPSAPTQTADADRRDRWRHAARDIARRDWADEVRCAPLDDGEFEQDATDLMAVADAEQAELRRERDLAIAYDRQPYPTAWAYEQACAALHRKTEAIERVRLLHDNLAAETDLTSPDDPITREAAAQRIAAALDGAAVPAAVEEQPDTNTPEAEPDVVTAIVAALQQRAVELSELAEEQMRPSLEERAQEWSEAADVARRAARAAASQPAAPFVPPVHYLRDDGVECCVHAKPVGPDSCEFCRELADDEGAAAAQPGKETTPCSVPTACDAETGEPCERHEREQSHAENDHSLCRRDECEVLRQS